MSVVVKNSRRLFLYGALLVIGYAAGLAVFPEHPVEASSDEMAPEVALKKLDGNKVNLSDYRGRWVFLNFWATWCPPCVHEMPSMESFSKQFKAKNLVMLAVSQDKGDGTKVARFIKEKGFTFDVFHDPDGEVSGKFNVYSLPSTYIINPKGVVVAQATGGREWNDPVIIDYFNGLMKKK